MDRLPKEMLESFDVHLLPNTRGVSLWVLEYLSDNDNDRFSPKFVAEYMVESMGMSVSHKAVHTVLSRAVESKYCHKRADGFKIMKSGQDELMRQMSINRVVLIEPGKPFSAGVEVGTIFSQMVGPLCFNDPYVDEQTLDTLHRYFSDHKEPIRVLTQQIKNQGRFKSDLAKMVSEGIKIEVGKVNQKTLHDRYFIDNGSLWISGNSLNNIGQKESFLVRLDGSMRDSMLQAFNDRWCLAVPV